MSKELDASKWSVVPRLPSVEFIIAPKLNKEFQMLRLGFYDFRNLNFLAFSFNLGYYFVSLIKIIQTL